MIGMKRAGDPVVWGQPQGASAGPMTWRKIMPSADRPSVFAKDLALCTCPNGHECCLSGDVHTVSEIGIMSPSYVCPVGGCGFHDWVYLEGWEP